MCASEVDTPDCQIYTVIRIGEGCLDVAQEDVDPDKLVNWGIHLTGVATTCSVCGHGRLPPQTLRF